MEDYIFMYDESVKEFFYVSFIFVSAHFSSRVSGDERWNGFMGYFFYFYLFIYLFILDKYRRQFT